MRLETVHPAVRPGAGSWTGDRRSLHVVRVPVLHQGDLGAVPFVDPVVLLGTEVVVLRPFHGTATQALEIDLQVLHRSLYLSRRRGPAGTFQRGFDHHAGDPTLGHLLGRIL